MAKKEVSAAGAGEGAGKPKEKGLALDTSWGAEIKACYTPSDLVGWSYGESLGSPGEFPYTRGIDPSMYRKNLWPMGQYAGFGSSEDTNKRFKFLVLEQGADRISVAFDLPTALGYDSDHELAKGEVGKIGVAIDSLADYEELFEGIPWKKIRQMDLVNSSISPILLAMTKALFEKNEVDPGNIRVTFLNDPLNEFIARGNYIFDVPSSLRLTCDVVEHCVREYPFWHPITISGLHSRWAGANPIQELAFALANTKTYIEAMVNRGLAVDDFAPNLRVRFSADMELFETAAKFRAARRIWARLMKETYGAKRQESMMLRLATGTAGYALTAQEPLNNIARLTIQALGAVMGGAQSISVHTMDEALSIPTPEAAKVSLRLTQIIAYETDSTKTVDPLGGSYFVESLTDKIEAGVLKYLGEIDRMGGSVCAIENQYFAKEIGRQAYTYQRQIDSGEKVIVAVNRFASKEEFTHEPFVVNPAAEAKQLEKLKRIREKRDSHDCRTALEELKKCAKGNENIIPAMMRATTAYATVGEICCTLGEVFKKYKEKAF